MLVIKHQLSSLYCSIDNHTVTSLCTAAKKYNNCCSALEDLEYSVNKVLMNGPTTCKLCVGENGNTETDP